MEKSQLVVSEGLSQCVKAACSSSSGSTGSSVKGFTLTDSCYITQVTFSTFNSLYVQVLIRIHWVLKQRLCDKTVVVQFISYAKMIAGSGKP